MISTVKNILTFFTLLSLSRSLLYGQSTGNIQGKIIDVDSQQGLPFINITVEGTPLGVSSKLDGSFYLRHVPPGKQHLNVSAVGYEKISREIIVEEDKTLSIEITLKELPVTTPGVAIVADVPLSAASSSTIRAADFDLRPKLSTQDLLRLVPGLFIAQHAGGGKAEQIFIRGFDCDHGTDVNISVDGIPVNMVSHGHGQGYADLHFVMPEILQGMDVTKGPYFATQGDFGTAGTVKFNTLDNIESNRFSLEGGMYGLARAVALVKVPFANEMTTSYVAGEVLHNDGYFDHSQDFKRYNLFGKLKTELTPGSFFTLWASSFGSSWDASGQIPERAIASGLINRFGTIDPTEGGNTGRHNINALYSAVSEKSDLLVQAYISRYHFQLFSNFTFYKDDPVYGDEIEQDDDRTLFGGKTEYVLHSTFSNDNIRTLFGSSVRSDDIANSLWHTAHRERLEAKADAGIRETNLAFYLQQDYQLSSIVHLQLGLRSDNIFFDVTDNLHLNSVSNISGSLWQHKISPKVNLMVSPLHSLDIYVNFGAGYHSNDARGVIAQRDIQSLPQAIGSEVGFRYGSSATLSASCAFWGMDIEHELVYAGDDGTTEIKGASRRMGVDMEIRAQLLSWLWSDIDVTVSRGRFKDLPDGENFISLAPSFTLTGGLLAQLPHGIETSLRVRSLNERPANEMNTVQAKGYVVFDGGIAYPLGNYKFSLSGENLTNIQWNEAQFDTESQLQGENNPVSELHFTPGTPLNIRAKVEYTF